MLIHNNYHKKLAFSVNGKPFGIEKNETKTVDEEIGRKLLKNYWIIEVGKSSGTMTAIDAEEIPSSSSSSSSESSVKKTEKFRKYKGRKTIKTK